MERQPDRRGFGRRSATVERTRKLLVEEGIEAVLSPSTIRNRLGRGSSTARRRRS